MAKYKIVVLSPAPEALLKMWATPIAQKYGIAIDEVEVVTFFEPNYEEIGRHVADADVVVGDYTFRIKIDASLCEKMSKVRLIQQPSTGYDHIDVEACARRGIPVANIGGANAISVAEHTIMLALMLLKRAVYAHRRLLEGQWTQGELMNVIGEVFGKTWGVLGMGRIGREVAVRAMALGAKVIYYDVVRNEEMEKRGAEYRPFNRLLAESDILSIHVPLTPATRKMIGERELRLMKPTAVVINVSRGEIVDEEALAKAVREGWIAGAGVDVFSVEPPPPDHPLIQAAREGYNVVVTPHIAGATNEARMRIINVSLENVFKVLAGLKPDNVVNMP
ncbi:2-hydroxyacid dehydrogenase [Pyrobaculum calidifontis]|uniref:D-isomer specific 2-hydroxyacid dehydrogenase, NAD-binding protein n=1 Tax=Pyrobaculum calidifontis (strain DSM 21063 / JCM 11548 / VA1) TaxID=410359 RepID=A3MTB6_PYRCJ|nr:2-hydroxyacid dehydrogenase [Pyrobaculum calidifontis]ABO07883.1 D-isomer specific 2-hydroxyacid dehydrogenase, NAD-binding protein [Pyrobaculum calidifontis JCM 11548]